MIIRKSPLEAIPSVTAYLNRVGATLRGFMVARAEEEIDGYSREVARIRFSRDGKIFAPSEFEPNQQEAEVIGADIRAAKFPDRQTPKKRPTLPTELKSVDPDTIYDFYDAKGRFLLLQHRVDRPDGTKAYFVFTYWSDGWRQVEPDEGMPLWGLEQLKKYSTIFVHEGAKAARHVRTMVDGQSPAAREQLKNHPFGEYLSHAAHVAWVTGAHAAHRTLWSELEAAGAELVIIVTDNDEIGRAALPVISKAIRIRTLHLQFTGEWPAGFDLADPFPTEFFRTAGNVTRYVGPHPDSLLHPATWATDQVPVEPNSKKLTTVLRPAFRGTWVYVEEPQLFVSTEMPGLAMDKDALNHRYRSLSHTPRVHDLVLKDFRGRILGIAYRPDQPPGLLTQGDRSAYNVFRPPLIYQTHGDVTPFINFVRYLIPKPAEQHQLLRWIATLIARPGIRMMYGLLLVSETQGTGKSTLAEGLLVKAVGEHNCSFPTERDIVDSQFNPWLARKRLVVVREIYAGHSYKAYNNLKALITEPTVTVNEKHRPQYTIENWAHFIASSNSKKALRMDESDRRWFYPTVTEERWNKDDFNRIHEWASSGGISDLIGWAHNFGDYVEPGEEAPRTEEKEKLIAESRSNAERVAIEIADSLQKSVEAKCVSMNDLHNYVRETVQGEKVWESKDDLRKAMRSTGAHFHSDPIKMRGVLHRVAMNDACVAAIKAMCPVDTSGEIASLTAEARDFLRQKIVSPKSLHDAAM